MSNKVKKTAPEIRFKGFTDDWEKRKLGEVVDFFDEKRVPIESAIRKKGKYPYYGATGIIDYVSDYLFEGEYVLLAEDGANITMRTNPLTYITFGKFWLNNHAHIMKSKNGSNLFLQNTLENINYEKYNSGTAQPKLNAKTVKNITIPISTLQEEEKIGQLLQSFDNLIAVQKRKLEVLKQLKQALLQQIFPQKDETNPRVRFANFHDDWEQRSLSSLLEKNVRKNKSLEFLNVESISNKTGFTKQTDQFEDYSVASSDLSNYTVINEKQFAYNPSRLNVGSIAYKRAGETPSVISPLYVSFSTVSELDDDFLWYWIKSQKFEQQRQRLSEGGVRDTLSYDQLIEMFLLLPQIDEQIKIGKLHKSIDTSILIQQDKIDDLSTFKQSLLQKMFI